MPLNSYEEAVKKLEDEFKKSKTSHKVVKERMRATFDGKIHIKTY